MENVQEVKSLRITIGGTNLNIYLNLIVNSLLLKEHIKTRWLKGDVRKMQGRLKGELQDS